MTIQDEVAVELRATAPAIHKVSLTKQEALNALGERAASKLGLTDGDFAVVAVFRYVGDKDLAEVIVELIPEILETNLQRIIRETPQGTKDACARALAEVAAGRESIPEKISLTTTETAKSDT